jgi:hypothetical protein
VRPSTGEVVTRLATAASNEKEFNSYALFDIADERGRGGAALRYMLSKEPEFTALGSEARKGV